MRELEVLRQSLIGHRFLDGVKVFTLHVFHDRQLQQFLVADAADHHGHSVQSGQFCRLQTPFSGDEHIIRALCFAHDQRLDDAVFFDGFGQFIEFILIEVLSWLVSIEADHLNGQCAEPHISEALLLCLRDEGVEAASKSLVHRSAP